MNFLNLGNPTLDMGLLKQYGIMLFLFLGKATVAYSQNIVVNPSFELFKKCPVTLGNLEKDIIDWKSPSLGSTDYFNACSDVMGTPENFNGEQVADFGVGYIGFYMYAPDDYREYIQAKLSSTLIKGEKYRVSFYVSLAERSDFAVKEFGIRFSEFPVEVETRKVLSKRLWSKVEGNTANHFEIEYSRFYANEEEWVLLSKEFVANGTENYMVIGNFKDNKRTQRFQTKRKTTKGSYYYLDMVSVYNTNNSNNETGSVLIKEYELETVHVFENVFFSFNKWSLKQTDRKELQNVVSYLKKNPNIIIKIRGHTDDIGSDLFNQKLSLNRAKTVALFLYENGISKNRIQYEGLGSEQPVATNKTKAGRLLNRRVEFVFLE